MSPDTGSPGVLSERGFSGSGAWYHILLVLLISAFVVQPWVGLIGFDPRFTGLFYGGVFAIALIAVAPSRRLLITGVLLFVPSQLIGLLSAEPAPLVTVLGSLLSLAFLVLMIGAFLHRIFSHTTVTAATISGAICVYLFLGIAWAIAFQAVDALDPGSFRGLMLTPAVDRSAALFYFSFTTLTTLGYGDIAPLAQPARSLAVGEAIVGQLYLVIMIARLVSLYTEMQRRSGWGDPPA